MANRYFLNIGTDYGSTANWSDTSGGAGGFSVPGTNDDLFFDGNSGNCDLNADRIVANINFTGYRRTIAFSSFYLRIYSNLTLSPTMTMTATTGYLFIFPFFSGTKTITSNGYVVPIDVEIRVSGQTITLADDFQTSAGKLLRITSSSGTCLINSNQIKVGGDLYLDIGQLNWLTGTAKINLTGTGSVSGNFNNGNQGVLGLDFEINTTGTITFNETTTLFSNFTYVTGTVVAATGSTLLFKAFASATKTLNLGASNNWYNLRFENNLSTAFYNTIFNLTSDINVVNSLSFRAQSTSTTGIQVNNNTIYCSGSLDGNSHESTVFGTTTVVMNGTGTITTTNTTLPSSYTYAGFRLPMNINTTGLVTLVGNFYYGGATFSITTPQNFDCVSQDATFYFGQLTKLSLNSDFQFGKLAINSSATVTGGNIHVLDLLTTSVTLQNTGFTTVTGCDFYLWGDYIGLGKTILTNVDTIGETLYLVGSKKTIFQTDDNLTTTSTRIASNIFFNKTGKLSIIGKNTKFSNSTTSPQTITYISGEVEMPRVDDRITFGASTNYVISIYGKVSKMRLRNVRFGVTSNRTVTFYDEFFCGSANNPLNIQGVNVTTPYADSSSTYLISNASSSQFDSHFTKISGVIWNGPKLNLTNTNKNNQLGNISVNSNTNQLAQGFSKNSPLIAKEPMFGNLLADPTVTK